MWCDADFLGQARKRDALLVADRPARRPRRVTSRSRPAIKNDNRLKLEVKSEYQYYADQTNGLVGIVILVGDRDVLHDHRRDPRHDEHDVLRDRLARPRAGHAARPRLQTPHDPAARVIIESAFVSLLGGIAGLLLALPVNAISTGTTNFQTFSEVAFNFRVDAHVALTGIIIALIAGIIGGALPALSRGADADHEGAAGDLRGDGCHAESSERRREPIFSAPSLREPRVNRSRFFVYAQQRSPCCPSNKSLNHRASAADRGCSRSGCLRSAVIVFDTCITRLLRPLHVPGLGIFSFITFLASLLLIALTLYGFAVFVRWMLRKLFWRVGRRLFLSYVLIGMLPFFLFAILLLTIGYMICGVMTHAALRGERQASLGQLEIGGVRVLAHRQTAGRRDEEPGDLRHQRRLRREAAAVAEVDDIQRHGLARRVRRCSSPRGSPQRGAEPRTIVFVEPLDAEWIAQLQDKSGMTVRMSVEGRPRKSRKGGLRVNSRGRHVRHRRRRRRRSTDLIVRSIGRKVIWADVTALTDWNTGATSTTATSSSRSSSIRSRTSSTSTSARRPTTTSASSCSSSPA